VGYASFAFSPGDSRYEAEHGRRLLRIARASLSAALGAGADSPASRATDDPWLAERRASFVTLMQGDELRGCVGTLEAHRALAEDVAANARSAAFQDTRFKPLTQEEFASLDIEVSLLSTPKRLRFEDHADLVSRLRPGVDGLILEYGDEEADRRATYLPQVWESLPHPDRFIASLKQKAGIPQDTDIRRCRVKRYTALKWREADFRK
jgi:AmmeMemoRadiSam system protein A